MWQKLRSHLAIFNESLLVTPGFGGWPRWVRGLTHRALRPLNVIKDGLLARDRASVEMLEEVKEVKRRMMGIIIFRTGVETQCAKYDFWSNY